MMSDRDATPQTPAGTGPGRSTSGDDDAKGAHTELRPAGVQPRPRAKVLPPELRDEPGEDDPFNDMPV